MTALLELVPASAVHALPVDVLRALAFNTNWPRKQVIDPALVAAVSASSDGVAAYILLGGCGIDTSVLSLCRVLTTLFADDGTDWVDPSSCSFDSETLQQLLAVALGPCVALDPWSHSVQTTWREVFDLLHSPPETMTFEDATKVSAVRSLLGVLPPLPDEAADWSVSVAQDFAGSTRLLLSRGLLGDSKTGRESRLWVDSLLKYILMSSVTPETKAVVKQFTTDQWSQFFSLWPHHIDTCTQAASVVTAA